MDNLTYIDFIALTVSLALMLPLMEKKMRRLVIFMIAGICSCLFVSELNSILLRAFNNEVFYVTTTITPMTEEIVKMLPILYLAIVISDDRRVLIPNSFAVGVGFALLENVVILTQNVENVTILWALVRGFGSGLVHGICTVMVGWGISYIRKRRKFFYCGTFALLSAAIIYHATYNLLVQSDYQYVGILLPLATYIPLILLARKNGIKVSDAR
ncbi:MAG: PrsW family intramembrane metalloprotease [Ruminococcus sp.]|nr:PrsW family intramembrane metalloprotease [Ruminococcus sp.]MBQ9515715.1 PrsW family intramembrane metalloprotease [Ruminococcus sp.]